MTKMTHFTATGKRCRRIRKLQRNTNNISVAGPGSSGTPSVYEILDQCSDIHKVLIKSQQILNDCRRELEDMTTQINHAESSDTLDAMTVSLDNNERFGTVNHKFMFNELDGEYAHLLRGVEALKDRSRAFGSLYDSVGYSFDTGRARKVQRN